MKKIFEYSYFKYDKTHKTIHSIYTPNFVFDFIKQIFLLLKIFLNQNAKPYKYKKLWVLIISI